MTRIGIILGSTRPNRVGDQVGRWVLEVACERGDAEAELLDLRDEALPLLDEPLPPSRGNYQHEHTKRWASKIAAIDGFVIVTPEYNHGPSAVLKNALDFLFAEWNNKAVGFVSYGSAGGVRAVEQLRPIVGQLRMADVGPQVALPFASDFEDRRLFHPTNVSRAALETMLDQVIEWTEALAQSR